ncbi:MAG TPA: hypothetical protein VLO09_04885 [Ornithinimicrobium sp.]|nr:hypothetical protein [Ornithinimicrobium sp.]
MNNARSTTTGEEVDTMTQVRELRRAPRATMMSWVPVTDAHGRTRMEMRWTIGEVAQGARTVRPAA